MDSNLRLTISTPRQHITTRSRTAVFWERGSMRASIIPTARSFGSISANEHELQIWRDALRRVRRIMGRHRGRPSIVIAFGLTLVSGIFAQIKSPSPQSSPRGRGGIETESAPTSGDLFWKKLDNRVGEIAERFDGVMGL